MKFISVSEASSKWDISDRRIRVLCSEGRIEGAVKIGRSWSIPDDAKKPADRRKKSQMDYLGIDFKFDYADELKERIDQYRPLTKNLAKSLHEKLIIEWTYNSNAIEGNTLTMSETKVVLEGITIGGKSMREHLETINHREAIFFIEDLIKHNDKLSEWNIKSLHSLILKDIDNENAGIYRHENVLIGGAKHIPPKHYELDTLMMRLIEDYEREWIAIHPIVRATLLHGEFVKIHPFIERNAAEGIA